MNQRRTAAHADAGARPGPSARVSAVALALLLLAAAGLRFAGLSWGLRHPAHVDEAVYVANVVQMVKARDLDHRFYTYPGLFFYLLAPGVALLGPARWDGPDPYLASRALVAAFGVLNVVLIYLAGARLLGRAAGLVAAAMLAASPVDVETSHQVRPDVLLEGFGIVALLAFSRLGPRLRDDARAGLLIGVATAVKFTGLLMLPFYLAARLLRPGPRLRGLGVAGLLAALLPVLATPYALIHLDRYRSGPGNQLRLYYESGPEQQDPTFGAQLRFYLGHVRRALGPVGSPLAVVGAALLLRRSGRAWGPPLLHPATVLLVMSTAAVGWARLILPGMGILYLCVAAAVDAAARLRPAVALVLALGAVAGPLRESAAYVNLAARPWPADQALDWIDSHVEAGARILETRPDANAGRGGALAIGVDAARYELVTLTTDEDNAAIARLVPHVDLVIGDRKLPADWSELVAEEQAIRYPRPSPSWWPLAAPRPGLVAIRLTRPRRRAELVAPNPKDLELMASENEGQLPALLDGDPRTRWTTAAPARGGEWIEVRFARELPLVVVELREGGAPASVPASIRIEAGPTGGPLHTVKAVDARPPLAEQARLARSGSPRPFGRRLILDGSRIRTLRLVQTGRLGEAWAVADLILGLNAGAVPHP